MLQVYENKFEFDFDQAMNPIWQSNIMYNESVLMISENGELPHARLLFAPKKILSVKDSNLKVEYTEGEDWFYEDGKLQLTESSKAVSLTIEDLYPKNGDNCVKDKIGGGYINFHEGSYFHNRQLAVTYEHAGNQWEGPKPKFAKKNLPNTLSQLIKGESIKITLFGDSISVGANASGKFNTPPNMPVWGELVVEKLKRAYSSNIIFHNCSLGGQTSEWGREQSNDLVAKDEPDMVIIAFGMNDGTKKLEPSSFKENIECIMKNVRSYNEEVEFILVATMVANPETYFAGLQEEYKEVLHSLTGEGVVLANMTDVHKELLKHKAYRDMTGNNINHPNDFLARCYAQFISGILVE